MLGLLDTLADFCLRWAFWEKPWIGAGGLACAVVLAALVRALYAYANGLSLQGLLSGCGYEYELLQEDLAKRQAQIRIALTASLWVADMCSDVYVSVTYFRNGYYVFGTLLVAITLGSGIVGFLQSRGRWQKADSEENIDYWVQGLSKDGKRKPGLRELALYVLQLQPLMVAYDSFQVGQESPELTREKVLATLCESVPSGLLQAYALAVEGLPRHGSRAVLVMSLALSLGSMADATNTAYRRLCAKGKEKPRSSHARIHSCGFKVSLLSLSTSV